LLLKKTGAATALLPFYISAFILPGLPANELFINLWTSPCLFFNGDYWVIQLDKDYKYAVVGHPKRTHLWILSRTPGLDENTFNAIKQKLIEQGYDPAKMIILPQKKG